MADRDKFRTEAVGCLARDNGTVALMQCIQSHFPEFDVYREENDLVINDGRRFLMLRRTGPNAFRTQTYVDSPSTNEIDEGGGHARDVDGLYDELVAFSEV
jgi:hypothetical protein